MVVVRSVRTSEFHGARQRRLQLRQKPFDPVDDLDDIRARLALDVQDHAGSPVRPGGEVDVFRAVDDVGDVGEPDRRPVAVGDDDLGVLGGGSQLVVGVDGRGLLRAVETAFRGVGIRIGDGRAQRFQIKPVGGEFVRVHADAHRGALSSGNADEADAGHLRDFLREARVHEVLDLRQRHRVGGDSQRHDRRVGRVHLAVNRGAREIRRQEVARRVDRGLHLLFRHIEGEIQTELERDGRGAAGARRGHLSQRPRHLAELAFQRQEVTAEVMTSGLAPG